MRMTKTGLWGALLAIGGLLGGGCALDWSLPGAGGGSGSGLQEITCPINGGCECAAGASCALSCEGNCAITCNEGATCDITCTQANCTITCLTGSSCQTDCSESICQETCASGADCSCTGFGCQ